MKVKGVSVKTLPRYVELKYPEIYDSWLSELEEEVRNTFISGIYASRWYEADRFIRQPLLLASKLTYIEPKEMAWDTGIFSAQEALNGIYRFFLRFGGPANMLKKVSFFLENYYEPANVKLELLDEENKKAVLFFYDFVEANDVIIYRIAGWGYQTLLTSGATKADFSVKPNGPKDIKMFINWS